MASREFGFLIHQGGAVTNARVIHLFTLWGLQRVAVTVTRRPQDTSSGHVAPGRQAPSPQVSAPTAPPAGYLHSPPSSSEHPHRLISLFLLSVSSPGGQRRSLAQPLGTRVQHAGVGLPGLLDHGPRGCGRCQLCSPLYRQHAALKRHSLD